MNPLVNAGFRIERLTDTKPVTRLREVDPDAFEKYSHKPTFMVIEAILPLRTARKRSGADEARAAASC